LYYIKMLYISGSVYELEAQRLDKKTIFGWPLNGSPSIR
jgi:hypothetical protein